VEGRAAARHDHGVEQGATVVAGIDPPVLDPGQVAMSGTTPTGLRVELQGYDAERQVATPSPYEEWPEGDKLMPPHNRRMLVIVVDDEGVSAVAGTLSWHLEAYGPTQGSFAWNIGIGLTDTCRGHGVGTVAQRLLAEWLLSGSPLDRIEASTDVDNVPEQRSLEKAGFAREGVLRGAQARADGVHDLVSYSLLRSDVNIG
jgi:RimJ/RimL family protein N-acetyltransferase